MKKVSQNELHRIIDSINRSPGGKFFYMDFSNLDFEGAYLGETTFVGCVFDWSIFDSGCCCEFNGSRLYNCSFKHAHLREVDFSDCDILGCDFRYADIEDAVFPSQS